MAFVLADDPLDLPKALHEAEPQAPKPLKPLLLIAAKTLEDHQALHAELAEMLELAAALRAGQMASQSKCDEIANEVRQTLVSVAARLRSA